MEPVLYRGDCLEVLEQLEPESIDAVVTDPPYGIGFMGREWDTFRPDAGKRRRAASERRAPDPNETNPNLRGRTRSPAVSESAVEYDMSPRGLFRFQRWCREWGSGCHRVLKPGGYLIAFGAPRAYHRLACGIEDAGFEVRDCIDWIFGTGFPKSVDGEREVARATCALEGRHFLRKLPREEKDRRPGDHICAETELSREFLGVGSALKPSHEPILIARKPIPGTLGANLVTFGTGGLHVDATRLGSSPEPYERGRLASRSGRPQSIEAGRWPPNLILSHLPDCRPAGRVRIRNRGGSVTGEEASSRLAGVYEGGVGAGRAPFAAYGDAHGLEEVEGWLCAEGCPVGLLDRQSGQSSTPESVTRGGSRSNVAGLEGLRRQEDMPCHGDAGGASRFFPIFRYEPKPDRLERDVGCEGLAEHVVKIGQSVRMPDNPMTGKPAVDLPRRNFHPTVKPLGIMRWLIRLVARPGQVIVDPFLGSGTTAMAAKLEGVHFIGIEREAEYLPIARARIAAVQRPAVLELSELEDLEEPEPQQSALFEGEAPQGVDLPCGMDNTVESTA